MKSRARIALLAAALLAAPSAFAEAYKINFHIHPQFGWDLSRSGFVTGADMKIDFGLLSIGPVAPQLEIFGLGSANNTLLNNGGLFGGAVGLRWRIINDEQGYRFMPGGAPHGNWLGNLWLDAMFAFSSGPRLGFNVGLGYEFSVIDGLQIGPFVKFYYLNEALLFGGLSFSLGGPSSVPDDFDPDNDGIKGGNDKCPDEAEDMDGFEDEDGCPEKDNDKDGIEDEKDKCKLEPEDKDGFQDDDGCPEKDNDQDGIPDDKDKCKNDPEDKDGFQDDDGCPDDDNDNDKVKDANDKCRDEAEDIDGFEDDDGCPDKDNDKDGIVDAQDKCPNEAETVNGVDDTDGCPEKEATVFVTEEKIVITEQIFFDTDKATIKAASNKLLDNVAEILKRFADVKKVRIEGHTDDIQDDTYNMKLSQKRAEAVRDALVKRGVDKARLEAQGFGETKPLLNEKTDAARSKNRRVEFVITDHGKK